MPDVYNMERAGESYADKIQKRLIFYRVTVIVLILLLLGAAAWAYVTSAVSSKSALREARDIRRAMKMLAIEQYSSGGTIFDPSRSDGLIPGGAERLRVLADADGRVILTGWDKTTGDALSFSYTSGSYIVLFNRNSNADADTAAEGGAAAGGETDTAAEDGSNYEVYLRLRLTDYH